MGSPCEQLVSEKPRATCEKLVSERSTARRVAWDRRQAEIRPKALCSLPFTAEAAGCKALWETIPTDIVTLILRN